MKYDVHIYAVYRVKVANVEATDQKQACLNALAQTDLDFSIPAPRGVRIVEYADEVNGFLVDEVGDEEYKNSRYYNAALEEDPPNGSRTAESTDPQ